MAISAAEVQRLAKLARLRLTEDETTRLAQELDAIVGYVAQLAAVDTAGVPPIAQVHDLEHAGRADRAGDELPRELALGNARHHDGECFLVPKVVER